MISNVWISFIPWPVGGAGGVWFLNLNIVLLNGGVVFTNWFANWLIIVEVNLLYEINRETTQDGMD